MGERLALGVMSPLPVSWKIPPGGAMWCRVAREWKLLESEELSGREQGQGQKVLECFETLA